MYALFGMYTLFVSRDWGCSYHVEENAETLDALRPTMDKLDKEMLRWFIFKDGNPCFEVEACKVYKAICKETDAKG